jgi:hypothetical protein
MTLGKGTIYEVTLDANKITDFDVMGDRLTIQHEYETHLHFPGKSEKDILQGFVFAWDKALNPPIKVTQAVLEAMNKAYNDNPACDRYTLFFEGATVSIFYSSENKWWCPYHNFYYTDNYLLGENGIQADCPLALQVLLGFIVEGVPV